MRDSIKFENMRFKAHGENLVCKTKKLEENSSLLHSPDSAAKSADNVYLVVDVGPDCKHCKVGDILFVRTARLTRSGSFAIIEEKDVQAFLVVKEGDAVAEQASPS
jgi:hypothetical protein